MMALFLIQSNPCVVTEEDTPPPLYKVFTRVGKNVVSKIHIDIGPWLVNISSTIGTISARPMVDYPGPPRI
jgi:hypothetical protein